MSPRTAALAILLLASSAAAAQPIVTDGDTIKLDGITYRIWGIDAAETKQACADGWMAGEKATAAMLELVKGRKITCEPRVTDRYGRTVALCRADGVDLGASMVSAGMAYAFTRYSSDYVSQERSAPGLGCTSTIARSLGIGGRGIGATADLTHSQEVT
jgi:endonuclease YncB( thermonuclease family)